jgi:SAM-dependent methyltransferase
MRPAGETLLEWAAGRLGLAPVPIVEAFYGPIQARVLHVAVTTGLVARLARRPARAAELAAELGLAPEPTRLLLACLAAQRHVRRRRDGRWALRRGARRWLDPASRTSVHAYLAHTAEYWPWWGRLEDVARGARPEEIHDAEPGDPAWRRYVLGQYELARLSAPEVARALDLGPAPRALLDVAGAHGWFAAALCRRHPGLRATVLDLPGAAAVGRELIAAAGMADRVRHVDGDLREAELGGPYDGVLAFNVLHHLEPAAIEALLARVHAALRPGGTLAVLDLFAPAREDAAGSGALLGLFFYVTSGAATYRPAQLDAWLARAGFGAPRRTTLRRLPGQTLVQARRG